MSAVRWEEGQRPGERADSRACFPWTRCCRGAKHHQIEEDSQLPLSSRLTTPLNMSSL